MKTFRKAVILVVLGFFLFFFSGCEFFFEEEERININEYTEQELIELIEGLLPEAERTVHYDFEGFEKTLVEMMEQNRRSVVGLNVQGSTFFTGGTGSAVIYRKEEGRFYAVKNHHVIDNYQSIEVVYEKNGMLFTIPSRNVEVLGKDATTDLAVISFKAEHNFPVATFADSYEARVGHFVFAVGNPLGFDYFGTLTMGVVSGLARYVPGSELEVPFIQHDAAMSPGNSGGALFNLEGEILGINNMKIVSELAGDIGFAIPSRTVERIIADLEEKGFVQRPFLGISALAQVSDCGQEYGVCVSTVEDGSGAEAAGLRPGDIIIGYKLAEWEDYVEVLNFNDLREAILNSSVGDDVSLRYIRNDEIHESPYTTLGIHPDDEE